MTTTEIEQYLKNVPQDSEVSEFRDLARKLSADDDGEEIFMLNLNRYQYAENEPKTRVPAAYQSYGSSVISMIFRNGGHPIYSGEFFPRPNTTDSEEAYWNEVILVRYRSRRDFLAMVTSDVYQEIARDRTLGIAYAEVSPTTSTINLASPRLLVLVVLLVPLLMFDCLLRRKTLS